MLRFSYKNHLYRLNDPKLISSQRQHHTVGASTYIFMYTNNNNNNDKHPHVNIQENNNFTISWKEMSREK